MELLVSIKLKNLFQTSSIHVIMTDIPSSIPNSTHNIIIVGYKANGDLIYMNPEKGYCYSVNQSYIKESYKIVIKGVK